MQVSDHAIMHAETILNTTTGISFATDRDRNVLIEKIAQELTAALSVEARKGGAVNRMLLEQMLQNAFFAGRGTSVIVSPEDMAAWQDYDYTKLEAYKRLRATLEAAALSADAEPVCCGKPVHEGSPEAYTLECCGNFVKPAPAVVVKALEWEAHGEGWRGCGSIIYDVYPAAEGEGWWSALSMAGYLPFRERCKSPEAAKAAAQADYEARILSALSAQVQDVAVPAGWKLVPVEPTEEMKCADAGTCTGHTPTWNAALYRAMLAVSPTPPVNHSITAQSHVTVEKALLGQAHAVMQQCGWHLALAGEIQGDGILEAACVEIEEKFRAMAKDGVE